jgi:AhpD family alkylhydroperoxidase
VSNDGGNSLPRGQATIEAFRRQVFADGALHAKTKHLIAVTITHVAQRPDCIQEHTEAVQRAGATAQELMEAAWAATEMRAGAAFAQAAAILSAPSRHAPADIPKPDTGLPTDPQE